MLRAVAFAFCVLAFVSQAHAFVCGNTIVEPGEECDDGNVADGDGCSSTCLLVPVDCGILTGTWHLAENSVLALIEDSECSISGVIHASDNPGGATLLTGTRFNSELTLVAGSTSFPSTFMAPDQINFANSALFTKVSSSLCGDSVLDAGEDCDDGNFTNGDGCTVACDLPGCGNHVLEPDEACDDGNQTDGDGCTTTCTLQTCGNGVIEPGEDCDDGNHTNGDGCSAACRFHTCGNTIVEPGEECDDGNVADGDGCSSTCLLVPVDCGIPTGTWHLAENSVLALIEDGECSISGVIYASDNPGGATLLTGTRFNSELTLVAGSTSFSSTFTAPDQINFANSALFTKVSSSLCGDSVLDAGEDCDDGNFTNGDGCTVACDLPGCGNHVLEPDEACDDGNQTDGDGCTTTCTLQTCGNGVIEPGEDCDDANHNNGDGCSAACRFHACGNSVIEPGEECDDGNMADGDGCSSTCLLVPVDCGIVTGTWHQAGNSVMALIEDAECNISGVIYATNNPGGATMLTGTRFNSELTLVAGSTSFLSTFRAPDQINFANSALFTKVSSSLCGDSVLDVGEDCDDGNFIHTDTCNLGCRAPGCGNGIPDADEDCDDGNRRNGDGCNYDCSLPQCGNNIVDPNEQCDDGNLIAADGCDDLCGIPGCPNSAVDVGEECDDGNLVDNDACARNCTFPRCGNYIWEAGEYCDEGVGSIACDQDCTAPFDGFKCYGGKDLANPEFTQLPVSTSDQLVPDETLELTSVKFVCTMTEMNGGEINQASSLICYRAKGTTLLPRPTVEVSSQFEVSRFELKKPHLVCVPGTISSLP